ncbi:MAG: hypothetical protein ACI9BC_002133, partial [Crocinitomicaceae bacterium]
LTNHKRAGKAMATAFLASLQGVYKPLTAGQQITIRPLVALKSLNKLNRQCQKVRFSRQPATITS